MKKLLIVAHTPSKNTKSLAQALLDGAKNDTNIIDVECLIPFDADAQAIARADGLILFTTENFGYMSGALKDLFDRVYYDLIDSKRGLPYALVIRAGKDGTGARRSTESITKGLGWSKVQEALILKGDFRPEFQQQLYDLGQAFAIGLNEGIF